MVAYEGIGGSRPDRLKEGAEASNSDIREFVAQHLADFKVPRKVIFIDEIPKGATGKLQRIRLHEKLDL